MYGRPYLSRCEVRSWPINSHLLRYVWCVSANHRRALIVIPIYLLLFPSLMLHLWFKWATVTYCIVFIDPEALSGNHIEFEGTGHCFEIVFSILLLIELLANSMRPLTACLSCNCYSRRGFPPVMMRRTLKSAAQIHFIIVVVTRVNIFILVRSGGDLFSKGLLKEYTLFFHMLLDFLACFLPKLEVY